MSWKADTIYTLADSRIIAAFQANPTLANRLYQVNNLAGIRDEHTLRERSRGGDDNPYGHGLPELGLLAIAPPVYHHSERSPEQLSPEQQRTARIDASDKKWRGFKQNISADFAAVFSAMYLDEQDSQLHLYHFLFQLNQVTGVPLVHYQGEWWGGDLQYEICVVFDQQINIWRRCHPDPDYESDPETWQWQTEDLIAGAGVDSTPLQLGLNHLGLTLTSDFFALHQSSFDWSQYHILSAPLQEISPMVDSQAIMAEYQRLNKDYDKIDFLDGYIEPLNAELAHFFLAIATDMTQDDDVRISALKIIGLYHGDYDHSVILQSLSQIVVNKQEDDYVKIYACRALEFCPLTEQEIRLALTIVNDRDGDINLQAAAFALLRRHRRHSAATKALQSLLKHEKYAQLAQMALDNMA